MNFAIQVGKKKSGIVSKLPKEKEKGDDERVKEEQKRQSKKKKKQEKGGIVQQAKASKQKRGSYCGGLDRMGTSGGYSESGVQVGCSECWKKAREKQKNRKCRKCGNRVCRLWLVMVDGKTKRGLLRRRLSPS